MNEVEIDGKIDKKNLKITLPVSAAKYLKLVNYQNYLILKNLFLLNHPNYNYIYIN